MTATIYDFRSRKAVKEERRTNPLLRKLPTGPYQPRKYEPLEYPIHPETEC